MRFREDQPRSLQDIEGKKRCDERYVVALEDEDWTFDRELYHYIITL